jgi:hypothetical protein
VAELETTGRDPLDSFAVTERGAQAKTEGTVHVLIQSVRPSIAVSDPDRNATIAMCIAAKKRTEGILANSRRQRYAHAALFVASHLRPRAARPRS